MAELDLTISELHELLMQNKVTGDVLFEKSTAKAKQLQAKYNSFVTIIDDYEKVNSNTLLTNIPYALKDNISTKNILTTASSNILKNYVPIYDATIYKKLKESGAVLMGKTVLDELAMGGTGTTGHTGIVKNPWDDTRLVGGSSSGSAAAVSLGIVPFAIGSDTGDSIRKPASFTGIVGFKPTYGRISRYGLFPFASSLDHLGVLTRTVKDAAIVTDIIKGHDDKDMTSLKDENISYLDSINNDVSNKKLFYIKEIIELNTDNDEVLKQTINSFKETINKIKELGISVEEVSFDRQLLEAIYPTYITISSAEATSNNANLTGILFGNRDNNDDIEKLIIETRTKGFSELIKRRFILGSYILQKENQEKLFLNACRIRRLITERMNELFTQYDALILPACGGIAPIINEDLDKLSDRYLLIENHLAIGNFGGYPSITIPSGFINGMPIAINLTGMILEDANILNLANAIEQKLGYANLIGKCDANV